MTKVVNGNKKRDIPSLKKKKLIENLNYFNHTAKIDPF